jgi:hypothetical protein
MRDSTFSSSMEKTPCEEEHGVYLRKAIGVALLVVLLLPATVLAQARNVL